MRVAGCNVNLGNVSGVILRLYGLPMYASVAGCLSLPSFCTMQVSFLCILQLPFGLSCGNVIVTFLVWLWWAITFCSQAGCVAAWSHLF